MQCDFTLRVLISVTFLSEVRTTRDSCTLTAVSQPLGADQEGEGAPRAHCVAGDKAAAAHTGGQKVPSFLTQKP